MTDIARCPVPTLAKGEEFQGFNILRIEEIPDIRVTAYEIEHEKTGAKIIHLHCEDKENLYAIGFRTPPKDSTGVPHIIEHSVLAGSDRYPLKDTFNELIKGTLQTFINAFTYPDKTVYPVASQVRTDFFNLARVYTDLALKPRLLKETLDQEGHHLEFLDIEDATSDLVVSGIVYNEMKGAYSSPDSLMYKAIQETLYRDSDYAHDSGGDPDVIPSLTYEQFRAFHRLYYSPSNARFFIYGDIPTKDHLIFLKEMLSGFKREAIDSSVRSQARWSKSVTIRNFYPIGKDENLQGKTAVNVAWMMSDNTDYETAILLEITSAMLVGSAAGPLRKALIDSGLGQDLSPVTGLERDLKQICFAVGLRGSEPDRASRIEELILDTLRNVVKAGFDGDLVEGTLHQIEFHGKEISRSAYPYGIILMGRMFHTWLYDGDPFVGLNFSRIIEEIRSRWAANPALFQEIVQRWFLDNPHRLLSVMEPSGTYQEEREKAFKKKMADRKSSLSPEDLDKIRRGSIALRKFQSEPDPPEAQAKLPKLNITDISRTVETIPTLETVIGDVPVMIHDLFTNGVSYLDLAFDISDISEDLHPFLPLLAKLAINMGAAGLTYEEMAKRIALKTGGIACNLEAGLTVDGEGNWQKMIFRVKSLHRNVRDAIRIISDILLEGDLSDENRLRDLIQEKKNRLHAAVVPSGHVFARRTAAAALSIPAFRDEQWHGRTQLRFISRIASELKDHVEELREKISFLRGKVFSRNRLLVNLTADHEGLDLLSGRVPELIDRLAVKEDGGDKGAPSLYPVHAGIAIPAQVSYVAQVWAAPTYGDSLSPSLLVASRHLSSGYLYKHIRVQGGAYGGSSLYSPLSGLLSFISYRDPHIVETLKVYREAVDFIIKNKVPSEELEKAIIGTIGSLDRPMDPASRGYTAMIRDFSRLKDEEREKFRSEILDMTPEKLLAAARSYFLPVLKSGHVAVYSSEENLRRANEVLETKLKTEALVNNT